MKAYTDIEQSKKLAEILPIESADSHYVRKSTDFRGNPVDGKWSEPRYGNTNSKYAHYVVQNFSSYEKLPCWSLSALLDYMHKVDLFPDITDFNGEFKLVVSYVNEEGEKILGNVQTIISRNENLIDGCVEMIVKLNEQNLL